MMVLLILVQIESGQVSGQCVLKEGHEDRLIMNPDSYQDNMPGYWLDWDLQRLLSYTLCNNFFAVISKAKTACEISGHAITDHSVDVNRTIQMPKNAERIVEDLTLTGNACYLIAQCGTRDGSHHFADAGKMVEECRRLEDDRCNQSLSWHYWRKPRVSLAVWTSLRLLKLCPQCIIRSTHPLRLACIAVTRILSGFFLRSPNVFRLEGTE